MIIWLASYPRSGNTFFRSVLHHYFDIQSHSIHGDHRDIGSNSDLGTLVGHAQGDRGSLDLDALRRDPAIYVVKTHDTPSEYMETGDQVIYVVRDGRDASTSYLKYLHRVAGLSAVSLQDIITGKVAFGFWGNHVQRWRRALFDSIHFFKFEEITNDPDGLADRLAEVFKRSRSRARFPDFEAFKQAAPNFFGSGKSGNFAKEFAPTELALFELYSGSAMRLAGYRPDDLSSDETAAYGAFCSSITDGNDRMGECARLRGEQQNLRKQLETAQAKADRLKSALEAERGRHRELTAHYKRLRRYSGVEFYRRLFPKQ